ncbi:MAG TPA: hypothetical protein ENI48_07510 [Thioploca sp.]|nr:MAG: hypothetical protein B6247_24615 [Beggiatoa sp. 4572_84]HEC85067.1 hypothetical protein [Thioploca sp.]
MKFGYLLVSQSLFFLAMFKPNLSNLMALCLNRLAKPGRIHPKAETRMKFGYLLESQSLFFSHVQTKPFQLDGSVSQSLFFSQRSLFKPNISKLMALCLNRFF